MPYSSSDLELSCLVALFAPDRVDRSRLTQYLTEARGADDETRERQMFALAGLAGLGESVLPAIRTAAADPSLTVRERLMIGLGAARLGDAATAREVATGVRDEFGERAGTMARLRVGTSAADITAATALMAVLAAAVGDELAPAYQAYVDENPSSEQLHALHAAAFVSETLARLPARPVSFSYTVAGVTETVDLDSGRSFELSLTATELASLTIELDHRDGRRRHQLAGTRRRGRSRTGPGRHHQASGLAEHHDRPGRPALGVPDSDVRTTSGRGLPRGHGTGPEWPRGRRAIRGMDQ